MSKLLSPGWHDYGELSVLVTDYGYCVCALLFRPGERPRCVVPYTPRTGRRAFFKAYSGHHTRYIWA